MMKNKIKYINGIVFLLVIGLWSCGYEGSISRGAWSSLEHPSSNWRELFNEKIAGSLPWDVASRGSYGFTDNTIWLHTNVESLPSGEWVVDLSWAIIDEAELFLVDGHGNLLSSIKGGSGIPYREKAFPSKVVALPFHLLSGRLAGETRHLFIALRSSSIILANPQLFWSSDYSHHVDEKTLVDSVFFGALFAFLILILVLGVITKDRILLLFLLAQGSFGCWLLGFSGLGYAYLWPNLPNIHPGAFYGLNGFFLSLWGVSGALFFEHFLVLKARNSLFFFFMKAFRYLMALLVPFWFWAPSWAIIHSVVSILGFAIGFALVAVFLYEVWQGSEEARLLLVGGLWSALVFLIISGATLTGDAQNLLLLWSGLYIAHFLFGVTITVSIAKKINLERRQRWAAQQHALKIAEDARENLQTEVDSQTMELRHQKSELERTVHELKEAQTTIAHQAREAAVGHVVSGFAHEVRNPLNVILGGTAAIEEVIEGVSASSSGGGAILEQSILQLTRCLRLVLNGSNRIQNLLAKLDTFVTETSSPELESVDVALAMEAAIERLQTDFPTVYENINIEWGERGRIRGTPSGLETIFVHLLRNALEATEGRGRIDILSRSENRVNYVTIRDKGVGISPQNRTKIFDAFFTTKEHLSAVGLGLAIASLLAKNFGGELVLTGEDTPLEFTEFELRLNLV